MAVELSLSVYERNLKNFNRKGLRRQFYSLYTHWNEYAQILPVASTRNFVFEVTVDKDSVKQLIEVFKNEGFRVLGSENYYFLENLVQNFELNKNMYTNIDPKGIEAIEKDLTLMKERCTDYKEIENEDCVFYFMPYNDGIETLYEFIKTKKELILNFAKENDITIMFKIMGYTNNVDGFFGFNFYDADKGDEDVIVDYASRITIKADFKSPSSVFASGMMLAGIGENESEVMDSELNLHILAENARYTK
ncbi:MAG: hypothetical protein IKP77_01545 [Acholeplasmatales bacterium]|nr:hypothetical protein [Acholeplasmatales bacterium]